jgi:hypothetical protein
LAICLALALLLAAAVASTPAKAAVGQIESWGKFGFGSGAEFSNPSMFGVDSSDGSVFAGDETEDHQAYRIRKLSPTGAVQGSVTISRYLDLPTPHEKPVALWGVAVDSSAHRFYVLEGGKQLAEGASGEFIAKKILVFSTEPEGGKLVAPSGGPSSLTLPTSETEALYKPLGIAVDPGSHDLLVMAEGPGSPKHIVFQRFNSTTGASLARFEDTANKLKPALKSAITFAVAPNGKTYTLTGRADKPGTGNTRLWELPSNLSSVAEVPGFATAFDAEEIPFGPENKVYSQLTGGPQLAISPSGKTIYWKERVEAPEEKTPGNFVIRGYSLTENATAQVYGGSSSLAACRITSGSGSAGLLSGTAFGVTGEGASEKLIVFDLGPLVGGGTLEPGTAPVTAPPYGDKVLTFGQGGSGCPVPVAKFKANGTEGNVKVAKGTTVTFDASGSVLTSGPANTPGFRKELIWKFGDGSEQVVTGSGGGEAPATTTHTYNTSGTFEATLQIHLKQPNYGNPALVSHKVEVEGGAPEFQLKVTKNGTGTGTVTSSPAGIGCGSECQASFAEGTLVKLTGTPDPGSKPVVWQSCPGTVNGSNQCEVTISAAKEAKATFDLETHLLTVIEDGTGTGTVTSSPAGISCGSECQAPFNHGSLVKLTGTPAAGSKPVVWESCPGTVNASNQCEVTVDAAKSATARFDVPGPVALSVGRDGTGSGTVTSAPAGIECGSTTFECSHEFPEGTLVKLTGTAGAGSKPVVWESCPGVVNGSNQCEVTMDAAKSALATFDLEARQLEVVKEGTGSGTVSSSPTGIDCGSECQASFADGTVVNLTGTPAAGTKAVVWQSCPGTLNGSNQCQVTMDAAKEAVASFELEPEKRTLTVVKAGGAAGWVGSNPSGIGCGGTCAGGFALGSVVKLTGTAGPSSREVAWSGCDAVTSANKCEVRITANATVTAIFAPIGQPARAGTVAEPPEVTETKPKPTARQRALAKCKSLQGKAKAKCVRKANEIGKGKKGRSRRRSHGKRHRGRGGRR